VVGMNGGHDVWILCTRFAETKMWHTLLQLGTQMYVTGRTCEILYK
jgi:hypothetical protein